MHRILDTVTRRAVPLGVRSPPECTTSAPASPETSPSACVRICKLTGGPANKQRFPYNKIGSGQCSRRQVGGAKGYLLGLLHCFLSPQAPCMLPAILFTSTEAVHRATSGGGKAELYLLKGRPCRSIGYDICHGKILDPCGPLGGQVDNGILLGKAAFSQRLAPKRCCL